jgi:uncharacterized protein
LREPCRSIVAAIADGRIEATTTVEVVQEFAHVRARRRGREDATALSADYLDLLSPLIIATPGELRAGPALFADHDRLGPLDAVLATTALPRGVLAVMSADRTFGSVPGLRHVVPDADGLASLLA